MTPVAVYRVVVATRLTDEDAARVKRAAAALSMSTSDFVRMMLLGAVEEVEREVNAA